LTTQLKTKLVELSTLSR
jgi:hypothetical protein